MSNDGEVRVTLGLYSNMLFNTVVESIIVCITTKYMMVRSNNI